MILKLADRYTARFRFSQADVDRFAEVTGDLNPIHSDPAYAATTFFKRPIMHGFLSGSIFSRLLGMHFPGAGTIYVSQELQFKKPMFVDTEYEAELTVLELRPERHLATIATRIHDVERNEVTLSGMAVIMNPSIA